MTPEQVRRQIAANRRRMLELEAAIAALILSAYQQAQRQIAPAHAALLAAYERELARLEAQQRQEWQLAEDDGEDDPDELPPVRIPPAWLASSHEAHHYTQTVLLALSAFALVSRLHITNGQQQAIDAGTSETRALLHSMLAPLAATVGVMALERAMSSASRATLDALLGMSATTGKALSTLLDGIGEATVTRLGKALFAALGTGTTTATLGRTLSDITDMAYRRALTVDRTELIDAYRGAGLLTMQANEQTVAGWIWRAGPTACPFCQSQDGTFHTLDEDLNSHPNCECQQEPVLLPLSDVLSELTS